MTWAVRKLQRSMRPGCAWRANARQQLQQSGLYTVIDAAPALPLIAQLKSQQSYLHDCNGCDLEIGKQLGADQVLVTWVDRVSGLILSLTYEFHDVATSQIVGRKSYDFRGDNDSSWTHAVKYMVRDLKDRLQLIPELIDSPGCERRNQRGRGQHSPPSRRGWLSSALLQRLLDLVQLLNAHAQ